MPDAVTCFRPDEARVAGKVIDGEAVIIDLTSGTYYSLRDAGSRAWELMEHGYSTDRIVEALVCEYDVSDDTARADLERLIGELQYERLIVAAETADDQAAAGDAPAERKAYDGLTLEIFRDMQDLLALDPPMPGLQNIPWK